MAKYKAKQRFSVTVMVDGANIYVMCDKGSIIDLDERVAVLVNHDSDVLAPVKKKGPGKNVKTGQVTEGHTR